MGLNLSASLVGTALLNKSIFQPEGGRSGMIRGEFTCERADAVQTQREPPSQDRESALQVTNWPEYNKALRQRGDITIWFTEEALAAWRPAKTGARGRPHEYSDLAIETALFIRQVFHLPLRQTEGFMNSLSRLMKSTIRIPDYSSISKRSISLPRHVLSQAIEPGSLVIVDSTGLKVYGKDEWHQEKHDVPARRTWRKLHLAIDEHHQVLACELTTPDVGDPTAVPDLLTQMVTPFETFMGDGAYDGEPVLQAVLNHQSNAQVVVPPHKTAICSAAGD